MASTTASATTREFHRRKEQILQALFFFDIASRGIDSLPQQTIT